MRSTDQATSDRLFPPWVLGCFGVAILLVLAALFPKQRLLDQVERIEQPTVITLSFLKNLVHAIPHDQRLRLRLATHELELGEIELAKKTLQPLLKTNDSVLRREALLLDLRLAETMAFALSEDMPARHEAHQRIAMTIRTLLQEDLNSPLLVSLAESAIHADHPSIAQTIYERIGKQRPEQGSHWYAKAANLALERSAYEEAARLYFLAQKRGTDRKTQRKYFLAALKALQAGNHLKKALAQADAHVGNLVDDESTLIFLISLGRAAGNGTFSQKYTRFLLQLSSLLPMDQTAAKRFVGSVNVQRNDWSQGSFVPTIGKNPQMIAQSWLVVNIAKPSPTRQSGGFDDHRYRLAYEVFLENQNLEEAYGVAERAVAQVPSNMEWRQRLAQVAEWTERPMVALEQWRVLAQRTPTRETFEPIRRLSPGLSTVESLELARTALVPFLGHADQVLQREALDLDLQLAETLLAAIPFDAPAHQAIHADIGTLLTTLLTQELPASRLIGLADTARRTGHPVLAQHIYERLGQQGGEQASDWYAQAATIAIEQGAHVEAARLYFAAQDHVTDRATQRRYFRAAVETLQSGNQLETALEQAETHLDELVEDEPTLLMLISLGRQADRVAFSQKYVKKLLRLSGSTGPAQWNRITDQRTQLAYDVFLENQNLEEAYGVAEHAVAQAPENIKWRQRFAQVAEWTGRPDVALKQWAILAQHSADRETFEPIRRLSQGIATVELLEVARAALLPFHEHPDRDLQHDALLLDLQLAESLVGTLSNDAPTRQTVYNDIGTVISTLLKQELSDSRLVALADAALRTNHPALAQRIYEGLGQQGGSQGSDWYAKAAVVALEHQAYQEAARLYFAAQDMAVGREAQRRYYLNALKAFQASNRLDQALTQAQLHLRELIDDESTLYFLITLGRAAGNGVFAQTYAKRLWAISNEAQEQTNDDQHAKLAYDVFLENQNLKDAYNVAERAVAQTPENMEWRQRFAQIAEWTGQTSVALEQWSFLSRVLPKRETLDQLRRLTQGLTEEPSITIARKALAPLLRSREEDVQKEAMLLDLQLAEALTVALSDNSPAQLDIHHQVGEIISNLLKAKLTNDRLVSLADSALRIGHQALAQHIYERVGQQDESQAPTWYAKAATVALGRRVYQEAARLYFAAQDRVTDRDEQRSYFRAAVEALQSGNQLTVAVEQTETHVGALVEDVPTLLLLIKLGRAAGQGAFAQTYAQRLWALSNSAQPHSFEDQHAKLIYDVFLENQNLDEAYGVAEHMVAHVPESVAWRQRLAQVAEWTGQPMVALQQWRVLAQRTPALETFEPIRRLSPGLSTVESLELARVALVPFFEHGNQDLQHDALLLDLQLAERLAVVLPADSPKHQNVYSEIGTLITTLLADEVLEVRLLSLADTARNTGHPALAQRIYERVGHQGGRQAPDWYAQAATLALAQGAYAEAARLYFAAQDHVTNQDEQREYFQAAVEALQSGNQLTAAVEQAKAHVGTLAEDPATLLLLIKLGRAAGQGAFAQTYAKRLWALSNKTQPHSFEGQHAKLVYDVFLENRNLDEAYGVAEHMVAHVPESVTWRQRLAQVAEWTGQPMVALQQWRVLAQRTPTRKTFETLLRLGRGLYDDESVIIALRGLGKENPLSPEQLTDLVNAYERVGRPEQAIAYLSAIYQQNEQSKFGDRIALLYERAGMIPEALDMYERLIRRHGPTLKWATKLAALHYQRGELSQAYQSLQAVKIKVPKSDVGYWKLLGDLAWDVQDDVGAQSAYQVLWQENRISQEHLERLIMLLKQEQPERAIHLARFGWKSHHNPKFLLLTLDMLVAQQEWKESREILSSLLPSEEKLFARNRQYWVLRAEVMAKLGHKQEAMRAYQVALELNPSSSETRATLLWFLIDQKEKTALGKHLNLWKADSLHDSQLWGPYAAAYVWLGQTRKALPYFVRKISQNKSDYLWTLNYADALEEISYHAKAWRIRQYVWVQLRKHMIRSIRPTLRPEWLLAYARLAITRVSGDEVKRLLHKVAKNTKDPVSKELLLAWYFSREEYDAARFWLWKNYEKQLTRPANAELTIALAKNDWVTIEKLLSKKQEVLTVQERVEAAQAIARPQIAQTEAIHGLYAQPSDHLLHGQFIESTIPLTASPLEDRFHSLLPTNTLPGANHTLTRFIYQDRTPLLAYRVESSATFRVLPRITLQPLTLFRWQQSNDTRELVNFPRLDKRVGANLHIFHGRSITELTAYYRDALTGFTALRSRYQYMWNPNSFTEVWIGRNLEADVSVGTLVGGVKDLLRLRQSYTFSKRDYVTLQFDLPWFYSQNREFLGKSFAFDWNVAHQFRAEYPDLTVRLTGTVQAYDLATTLPNSLRVLIPAGQAPSVDVFLPPDFQQVGVNVGVGESALINFSRAVRPFFDVGLNHNTETGFGQTIEGGLAGSPLGRDRLSLFGSHFRGGFGRNATITEFGMQYQLWF